MRLEELSFLNVTLYRVVFDFTNIIVFTFLTFNILRYKQINYILKTKNSLDCSAELF